MRRTYDAIYEHNLIKDLFNLIKIFLLNKMKHTCLNKTEIKIKFFLILGTNKQPFQTNVLFEENTNSTTSTDTAITLVS